MKTVLKEDYGKFVKAINIGNFKVNFFISDERDKVNPFNSKLIFLIHKIKTEYFISFSSSIDLNQIVHLIKNDNVDIKDELDFTTISQKLKCRILHVNRYVCKSFIPKNDNTETGFKKLNDHQINKLNNVCKISIDNLQTLSESNLIYLNMFKTELVGYGFVTRTFSNFCEISVATVKPERRKGIGFETVSKMTDILTKNGKSIFYITEVKNIASNKIAKKCGYDFVIEEIIGFKTCV